MIGSDEVGWGTALPSIAVAVGISVLLAALPADHRLLPVQLAVTVCLASGYVTLELSRALTVRQRPFLYTFTRPVFAPVRIYYLIAGLSLATSTLPFLTRLGIFDGPPILIDRLQKLGQGALLALLSSLAPVALPFRAGCAFVAAASFGTFAIAWLPALLGVDSALLYEPTSVLSAAIVLSALWVCVRVNYVSRWAQSRQDIDCDFGGPVTPWLAMSSCVATFVCLTWIVIVAMYGALQLGLPLFMLIYVCSATLGFTVVNVLRRRVTRDIVSAQTPYHVFRYSADSRTPMALVAAFSLAIMYFTYGYLEVRLLYTFAAVYGGPVRAFLLATALCLFVVDYVRRARFWGSMRTDALQLAHMLVLICLTMVLLVWRGIVDPSVRVADATQRIVGVWLVPLHTLHPLIFMNLLASNAIAVFGVPDVWSRFALHLDRKRTTRFSVVAVIALTAIGAVAGTVARLVLGNARSASTIVSIDEVALFTRVTTVVTSLDTSTLSGAILFCSALACGVFLLLAVMATMDTILSSWLQGWRVMVRHRRTRRLGWLIVTLYGVVLVAAHFPVFVCATFTFAGGAAIMPMWVARLANCKPTTIRTCDASSMIALSGWTLFGAVLSYARIRGTPLGGLESAAAQSGTLSILAVHALILVLGGHLTIVRPRQPPGAAPEAHAPLASGVV